KKKTDPSTNDRNRDWKPESERRHASYLDSCTPAFTHSIGHSSTRRVDHSHEADEAQVLSGEVHLISVKSKALWELVIRQVELAET
uniref:Uncharacterized protein n=1 Tax=Amphilophus citrinellus TaxID=61819 RepID=A0A3Q0QVL0_AMPCI